MLIRSMAASIPNPPAEPPAEPPVRDPVDRAVIGGIAGMAVGAFGGFGSGSPALAAAGAVGAISGAVWGYDFGAKVEHVLFNTSGKVTGSLGALAIGTMAGVGLANLASSPSPAGPVFTICLGAFAGTSLGCWADGKSPRYLLNR